jgi:hypothetical protein
LSPSDLLDHVRENPPDFDAVGIDERAEVEAAEERLRKAERNRDLQETRLRQLKRVTQAGGGIVVLALGVLAFDAWLRTEWMQLAVFGLGVIFGGMYLRDTLVEWPPLSLRRRRGASRRAIQEAEGRLTAARKALLAVQIEAGLKPALRTCINARSVGRYRTTVTLVEQEGLAEIEDPRYAIPTKARNQLDQFLHDMPGGSIGLSGPRGVGKTTLIRSVCPTLEGGPRDRFGFVVSAPVQFDPREFLLHLFAEACRTVLGPERVEELRARHPAVQVASEPSLEALAWGWRPFALLAGFVLILATLGSWLQLGLVVGVLLIAVTVLSTWPQASKWYRELVLQESDEPQREKVDSDVYSIAADRLEDIWYQQTFTAGWSGSLKAAVGQAGLEGNRELAKQQMTLPDIVAELRRLLGKIAVDRRVFIGIDELDKIESRSEAHRFMNELKVLFGIQNCFFLLSVSEDAMSSFERRGMPFRDVFDSSFDDVVNVGYLDVDESVELLQRRVVGMPLPFIFLCHCVAGGLARDVIRVAREIIGGNPGQKEGWPIHEACEAILAADLAAKINASLIATRSMPHTIGVELLRSWLQGLRESPITAESLLRVCAEDGADLVAGLARERPHPDTVSAQSPVSLAGEILTFTLYAACLLELFDPGKAPEAYESAHEEGQVERLAYARQGLSVHPRVAWEALRAFRQTDEIPPFPVPLDTVLT